MPVTVVLDSQIGLAIGGALATRDGNGVDVLGRRTFLPPEGHA